MRKPLFIIALILLVLAWCIEAGSTWLVSSSSSNQPSGLGIPALAVFDILLLLTVSLIGAPMISSHAVVGRIQGVITFFVALSVMAAGFLMFAKSMAMLFVMMGTLSMFFPYMVPFASFDVSGSAVLLSSILLLKTGFAICLVASHPKFLSNIGLVILTIVSIGLTVLVSFVQGLPPKIFASITDDISAIVISVISIVYALRFLISSIPAIKKAIVG